MQTIIGIMKPKPETKTTTDYYRYLLLKSKGVEIQYTGEEQ